MVAASGNPVDQWVVNPAGGSLTGCLVKVPKGQQCTQEIDAVGVKFKFDLEMD